MKVQYELLTQKFDDLDTTVSTTDLIKSMANGTGARHASVLKLGLREGLSSTLRPLPSSAQRKAKKRVMVV